MQVILLAGGKGTRLAEETVVRPKPLVEVGGKPILWHIMNIYAAAGHKDFFVACGYKGEMIKEYFRTFFDHNSDYMINLKDGSLTKMSAGAVDWQVGCVDTGSDTMTGGRILRLRQWINGTFMATYGDGVGDVDIRKLVEFHQSHGRIATVTAVRPPARFGALAIDGDRVSKFSEKPQSGEGWINGGYFVFEPKFFDYLAGDDTILEHEPLERLSREGQLMAYKHPGFWQPMDMLRDKQLLEGLWASGKAPWKVWK